MAPTDSTIPEAADVELAPAVIARIAAFPLARVADLAEPALAACARAARPSDASAWSEYCVAYDQALARSRDRLWNATVEDPAFMRAWMLVHPDLAGSFAAAPREPRTKSVRHRETSLYRYLARAVARPDPNGMWTGVTLADWGAAPGIQTAPAPAHHAVAPDLGFFAALFAGLVAQPAYRRRGLYKLNPTLRRHEGGHRFSVPDPQGDLRGRRIEASRVLHVAIDVLGRAPVCFSFAAAAEALRAADFPEAAIAGLLDMLVERGVLVGGLRFPTRFFDAWEALQRAACELLPEHRAPWDSAVAELRACCAHIVADERSPDALADVLARARQILVSLAAALERPCPPLPRSPLRCDLRSPFVVTLGPDLKLLLATTVSEFAAFSAHLGMGGALSPALVHRWLGDLGQDLASFTPPPALPDQGALTTWEALGAELGPALAERAARWVALLTDVAADELCTPPQPHAPVCPGLGSLVFSLGGAALGHRLVIRGLLHDATPAFARCAALLEPEGGGLTRWLTHRFAHVASVRGIDHADLSFAHGYPNVLARPRLVPHHIDYWGADPEALDVRGARVERDAATGTPVCVLPGHPRALAVFSFGAAVLPPGDACQHLLLLSSRRHPPQIPRGGNRIGFAAELVANAHSPRVRLPGGPIVRTRRTTLGGDHLEALLHAARGPARFAAWQRLAARCGWPALVLVHRDGETRLLVPRDSPLAVEAAFEGAGACTCLIVEEFVDDACIVGPDGARFVAEFALPFVWHVRSDRDRDALAAGQPHAPDA